MAEADDVLDGEAAVAVDARVVGDLSAKETVGVDGVVSTRTRSSDRVVVVSAAGRRLLLGGRSSRTGRRTSTVGARGGWRSDISRQTLSWCGVDLRWDEHKQDEDGRQHESGQWADVTAGGALVTDTHFVYFKSQLFVMNQGGERGGERSVSWKSRYRRR